MGTIIATINTATTDITLLSSILLVPILLYRRHTIHLQESIPIDTAHPPVTDHPSVSSDTSNPSLSLVLVFSFSLSSYLFCVCVFLLLAVEFPYPSDILSAEAATLTLLALIDAGRLALGHKGNLTQTRLPLLLFVLLSCPVIVGHVFFFDYQTYVMRLDSIINVIALVRRTHTHIHTHDPRARMNRYELSRLTTLSSLSSSRVCLYFHSGIRLW